MPVKRCSVKTCMSCTTRNEDKGVTFHKFPKDDNRRGKWKDVTHTPIVRTTPPSFVCSRHFCKGDFVKNKENKYNLKSDAVPSIFPWNSKSVIMEASQSIVIEDTVQPDEENAANVSGSSKGSEIENLDNIKKFIEAQEKDNEDHINKNVKPIESKDNVVSTGSIEDLVGTLEMDLSKPEHVKPIDPNDNVVTTGNIEDLVGTLEMDLSKPNEEHVEMSVENIEKPVPNVQRVEDVDENVAKITDDETLAIASSVMEMILTKTEAEALETETTKDIPEETINSGNQSMPLSVGCKVEAKDFSEDWFPADILEVDYDEMEVLVHYDISLKKPDEWINVSSPRLRPYTGITIPKPNQTKAEQTPETEQVGLGRPEEEQGSAEPVNEIIEEPKELKIEDKNKYVVGERCLARWRDNRRFVAVIDKDLGDGKFEVIFDDGFRWPCTVSRLSKLKDNRDLISIDTSVAPSGGAPSPISQGGPSCNSPPVPAFIHTHLFDPTTDYLCSKSERREKKRKLNIKEIFNIGQKKAKVPKVEKEKDKTPKEKKVVKKVVKQKPKVEEVNIEKPSIPDAVASIIGTISEIKKESEDTKMDIDNGEHADDSLDSKCDLDMVEEEDKLERFDKPDQKKHDEVIDKMKEAISKLENRIKEECFSPKSGSLEYRIKQECFSPKSLPEEKRIVDASQPSIEQAVNKFDTSEVIKVEKPDSDTDIKTCTDNKEEVSSLEITKLDVNDATTTDLEVSVVDVPSPSLIEDSDAVFEKIVHDDDSTKSDIDMGPESPRLDIDSQPILVDIDAPLDVDQPDDFSILKKSKKLKIKDFVKKPKKAKKEQKKKLLNQKWKEVDKVKNELAEMRIKMKEMMLQIEREKQAGGGVPLPESSLLPNEWACRWVNGQPVGKVSEMEAEAKADASGKPALPRRSVEVVDKRLPEGWTKHMVRRSVGHSAGKWDVVLVNPENRRFHTKTDMRNYLETADDTVKAYEFALMDFGIHLKLARKMGWIVNTPDGVAEAPETILPADSSSCLSPLVKRKPLSLKKRPPGIKLKDKSKKRPIKLKLQRRSHTYDSQLIDVEGETMLLAEPEPMPILEDGYVWVGSLKVQIIDTLLRCPAEGCFKNFRNDTLLKMHIKHYHRELRKMLGATPKVLDLAAARTKPTAGAAEHNRPDHKILKVKINRPPKREEPKSEHKQESEFIEPLHTPTKNETLPKIPRSQDSPKLRNALANKPVKRPKVLLPMRRLELEQNPDFLEDDDFESPTQAKAPSDVLDFEAAISTHTVTKPLEQKKKGDKKKSFASFSKNISEDEEWFAMNSDELETRSSFPRSGTPDDSKMIDPKTGFMMSSDAMDDPMDPSYYTFTETGQRIKIVRMRREEIINCHCGFREEDGLMVQCELCLCWQHALCHNIHRESEVPEKYTCSICLNPRRGRRSKRFLHDQDRLYDGILPGAKADECVRRSHELSGNLLRIEDALHALRVKAYVATKKVHPKLYLWAKDWEQAEITYKMNSDYSDLSIMINGMDKENLPMKPEEPHLMDIRGASEDDPDSDRYSQRDSQLGSQALLSGLLSSPSAASLELPISTSELERLAKTVQEAAAEWQGQAAPIPQPEAAIDNDVCRERLLKHILRCQASLDSRMDSIDAQVAELESQDPSFGEHYETAEYYPRIKQTVQMLMRDLDTMEELGLIT